MTPYKQRPHIFISSTVFDLLDVRGALKHYLEKEVGAVVFASDYSDFPVEIARHSYANCLERLKSCALVILVIDKRYGGLFAKQADKQISITRQEVRVAVQSKIPLWTFVRRQTWDERNRFKRFVEERRASAPNPPSLDSLFAEFKRSAGNMLAQRHEVFDFIDEVTAYPTDNWIQQFNDTYDLLEAIEHRIVDFLKWYYSDNSVVLLKRSALEVPDTIRALVDACPRYAGLNEAALLIQTPSMMERDLFLSPKQIIKLEELKDRSFDIYSGEFLKRLGTVTASRRKKTQVFVTDTSMEFVSAQAWQTARYHRRILDRSREIARKCDLGYVKYRRVLLLPEYKKVLIDDEYRRSIDYVVSFHRATRIGLGICRQRALADVDARWQNFYLIPGRFVGVYDQVGGLALEFDVKDNRKVVQLYTEYHSILSDHCDRGDDGFWVQENMTPADILREIVTRCE